MAKGDADAAGVAVVWEGDQAKHVFEVVEGTLRALRILSDGRRVIIGFLQAGDLLGVSLKEQYLYTVEAITPVERGILIRSPSNHGIAEEALGAYKDVEAIMPATSAGLARRVLHAATRVYQGLNLERRSKPLLRENALGEAGRASDRDAVREINEVGQAP